MTKNSKARGNLLENNIKHILQGWGFVVEKCAPHIFWVRGRPMASRHDFFGCYDMVAYNPDSVIWVQVTTQSNWGSHVKKMLDKKWPHNMEIYGFCWHPGRKKIDKRYKEEKRFTLAGVFSQYKLNHGSLEFELICYVDKEGEVISLDGYQEYCRRGKKQLS